MEQNGVFYSAVTLYGLCTCWCLSARKWTCWRVQFSVFHRSVRHASPMQSVAKGERLCGWGKKCKFAASHTGAGDDFAYPIKVLTMRKTLSVMAVVAVSLFSTAGLVSCGDENDNAENAFYEAERGGGDGGVKGNGNNGNGSEGNGSEGNGDDSNKGTHETVDLGLPSGIRWATCNVGASAPHEAGCYFAWGETDPKATY